MRKKYWGIGHLYHVRGQRDAISPVTIYWQARRPRLMAIWYASRFISRADPNSAHRLEVWKKGEWQLVESWKGDIKVPKQDKASGRR